HEGEIHPRRLPFYLVIHRFFRNAQLAMGTREPTPVTQGIGTRIAVREAPPVSSDEEVNNVTAFVEVLEDGRSRGVWLLSSGLGAPQSFGAGSGQYTFYIRPKT